jgi:Tetratricopeptide repeat
MSPDLSLADRLYQVASQAFARAAFNDAHALAKQILAVQPSHFLALLLLGHTLEQLGQIGQALSTYDRAIDMNPGHAQAFTRRAVLLFREKFGSPPPPRTGYPERHAVSMTSLGSNGRFGNQLLQYAFTRIYAEEHSLGIEIPDWIGRDLYDLDDPFPTRQRRFIDGRNLDYANVLNNPERLLADCDLFGYCSSDWWARPDRSEQFRALFRPSPKLAPFIDRAMAHLQNAGRTLVAVHLRRGDYGREPFYIVPTQWYLDWLNEIWNDLDRPLLYIASDDSGIASEFAKYVPLDAHTVGIDIPGAEFYIDHYILSRAHYVATANSTFSTTAAMLNREAVSFLRPERSVQRLVAYNPWAEAESRRN